MKLAASLLICESVLLKRKHACMHVEEGVRGVRISKNRTEIRINTAQNNIRKPQTALRLPEDF